MFIIEDIEGKPLKEVLKYYYYECSLSDAEISERFLKTTGIKITRRRVCDLRSVLGIQARTQTEAVSLKRRCPDGKTYRMHEVETALGGQEIDKLLLFLSSQGFSFGYLLRFLNGYPGVNLKNKGTLFRWFRYWGHTPQVRGVTKKEQKRRQKISRGVTKFLNQHPGLRRRYYQEHPELRFRLSEKRKAYYQQHPEEREYRSLLLRQRWQAQKEQDMVVCLVMAEKVFPEDCQIIRQSLAGECQAKQCPLYPISKEEVRK